MDGLLTVMRVFHSCTVLDIMPHDARTTGLGHGRQGIARKSNVEIRQRGLLPGTSKPKWSPRCARNNQERYECKTGVGKGREVGKRCLTRCVDCIGKEYKYCKRGWKSKEV